jgi:hypothetical protein
MKYTDGVLTVFAVRVCLQIFEAEQDNLYFEHVSAGRALIAALQEASCAQQEVAVTHCAAALQHLLSLLCEPAGQSTYQPALFRYFYLSLVLTRAVLQGEAGGPAVAVRLQARLGKAAEAAKQHATRVHPWIAAELLACNGNSQD